jgi:alginate O-acetyltransferase complex protein AlgI
MYFQSAGFLFIFLPIFLLSVWLAPKGIAKKVILLVLSYLFYSGAEPFFILLLVFSSIVDFFVALQISSSKKVYKKKLWLGISIFVNIGLLAFYKYGAFTISALSSIHWLSFLHFPADASFYKSFVLPAGISFYTFQSMSYSIDVYRGTVKPTRDIVGFFCYVAYLPQLVAGPIERFNNLYPQIESFAEKKLSGRPYWSLGLDRLCLGIAQKLVIADSCGRIVDTLVSYRGPHDLISSWAISIGFGLQIYYDFAAYTSMAIGISLFMGIRLSENFLSPYRAINIREFWRKWHITLSNWLRDYLYIPLGGSKRGHTRTVLNILITFMLCGLWHGAGGNYILWGILHGILLSCYFLLKKNFPNLSIPTPLAILLTYLCVHITWIPFRVQDTIQMVEIWSAMFGSNGLTNNLVSIPDIIFLMVTVLLTVTLPNCGQRWPGKSGSIESLFIWATALFAILNSPQIHQFIYFQF